jgi:CheY-like chemotaxis protein
LKILVVDDHPGSMTVLRHALSSRGHVFEGVESRTEALDRAASLQPDVVLYEWHLRDGALLGFARQLRAALGSGVVLIALSAQNEPPGFRDSEDVDGYLTKPFDIVELEALLER